MSTIDACLSKVFAGTEVSHEGRVFVGVSRLILFNSWNVFISIAIKCQLSLAKVFNRYTYSILWRLLRKHLILLLKSILGRSDWLGDIIRGVLHQWIFNQHEALLLFIELSYHFFDWRRISLCPWTNKSSCFLYFEVDVMISNRLECFTSSTYTPLVILKQGWNILASFKCEKWTLILIVWFSCLTFFFRICIVSFNGRLLLTCILHPLILFNCLFELSSLFLFTLNLPLSE